MNSDRIYEIIAIADRLKSKPHKRLTPQDIKMAHDAIHELLMDGTTRPMAHDTLKAIEDFQTRRVAVVPSSVLTKLTLEKKS